MTGKSSPFRAYSFIGQVCKMLGFKGREHPASGLGDSTTQHPEIECSPQPPPSLPGIQIFALIPEKQPVQFPSLGPCSERGKHFDALIMNLPRIPGLTDTRDLSGEIKGQSVHKLSLENRFSGFCHIAFCKNWGGFRSCVPFKWRWA